MAVLYCSFVLNTATLFEASGLLLSSSSHWRNIRLMYCQWLLYMTKIRLLSVFQACALNDRSVSSGRDTQYTENCANGGLGVRSLWWCRHTGLGFMAALVMIIHLFHQPVSFRLQPTDIYPALLVAPGHWLPSSLPAHCLSLLGLGMRDHGKANNHLLAWQEEWESRHGMS